jgi:transposase
LFLNLKSLNPIAGIEELLRQLRQTEEQLDQSRREKQRLEDENARLREEHTRLRKELETAQRAAKRQAAPFSRGKRKNPPKSPGRKPGNQYGKHRRRPIPDG